ncbi:hypothetical protein LXL04_015966 [Taraxacum kok-saghyz]
MKNPRQQGRTLRKSSKIIGFRVGMKKARWSEIFPPQPLDLGGKIGRVLEAFDPLLIPLFPSISIGCYHLWNSTNPAFPSAFIPPYPLD